MALSCAALVSLCIPSSARDSTRSNVTRKSVTVARSSARASLRRVSLPSTSQASNVFANRAASLRRSSASSRGSKLCVRAEVNPNTPEKEFIQNKEFGYSRKDIILIGVGLLVAGFGSYFGMLAAGVDLILAGNIEVAIFVLGLTLAWTASYVFRVAKKDMTYVKQLKDYEEAVMKKRLEEMPEAEVSALLSEMEDRPSKK
eukprot:CAMPEP_0198204254 /NCGR_PEP_ID=MMETSP1445-20131203/7656_1 /TAXON_ID=36898 /ORGANISM="Pyramimonas sp., Strain CCMP2087" /LENGTH=200 /DNA_ID=CAMNT_0043876043 /DNA_START=100 /DNA_END=702 /DNA_ORIENTATION=-